MNIELIESDLDDQLTDPDLLNKSLRLGLALGVSNAMNLVLLKSDLGDHQTDPNLLNKRSPLAAS